MKYKVGDKVRIRSDLSTETLYPVYGWFARSVYEYVKKWLGKSMTISAVFVNGYHMKEDKRKALWKNEMIEGKVASMDIFELRDKVKAILKDLGIERGDSNLCSIACYSCPFNKYTLFSRCKTLMFLEYVEALEKLEYLNGLEKAVNNYTFKKDRVKEMTVDEVSEKLGYKVKIVGGSDD